MDVDEGIELAHEYGITEIPTFKMLKNSKVVDSMEGMDAAALGQKIEGLAGKPDRWGSAVSTFYSATTSSLARRTRLLICQQHLGRPAQAELGQLWAGLIHVQPGGSGSTRLSFSLSALFSSAVKTRSAGAPPTAIV